MIAAGSEAGVNPGDRVYTMGNHTTVSRGRPHHALRAGAGWPRRRGCVFVRLATVSMTTLVLTPAALKRSP